MPGLSRRDLQALIDRRDGPCISLYMPTERTSPETKQNPIRLKNLLTQAEAEIQSMGVRPNEVDALLSPGRDLLDDTLFWQRQSDGLALFLADDWAVGYRQPLDFSELVVVGSRFHIKPLLPLVSGDRRFYVLALSKQEVRVLEGTDFSVDELEVEDVPESLAEALKYDEFQKQTQWHTHTSPQSQGRYRRAIFHGHGARQAEDDDDAILRYFRMVDDGLSELLGESDAPLIVAAVDYLHPLYAEASSYPHLMTDGIFGNPETLSPSEIHEKAWDIVGPQFAAAQEEAVKRYHSLLGTGKASNNLLEVVPAAYDGRVDVLFVAVDMQAWGRYEPETAEVHLEDENTPDNDDLLDKAAARTWASGGTVYAVERDQMPGDTGIAAVFRY